MGVGQSRTTILPFGFAAGLDTDDKCSDHREKTLPDLTMRRSRHSSSPKRLGSAEALAFDFRDVLAALSLVLSWSPADGVRVRPRDPRSSCAGQPSADR
jgi:hypothetical protein